MYTETRVREGIETLLAELADAAREKPVPETMDALLDALRAIAGEGEEDAFIRNNGA